MKRHDLEYRVLLWAGHWSGAMSVGRLYGCRVSTTNAQTGACGLGGFWPPSAPRGIFATCDLAVVGASGGEEFGARLPRKNGVRKRHAFRPEFFLSYEPAKMGWGEAWT